jgi:hypothetical protein
VRPEPSLPPALLLLIGGPEVPPTPAGRPLPPGAVLRNNRCIRSPMVNRAHLARRRLSRWLARPARPPPVVEPALVACLPSDMLEVAGAILDLVRTSALYEQLGLAVAASRYRRRRQYEW